MLNHMYHVTEMMLFGKDADLYDLNQPQNLDIATPSEYLFAIKEAREAGASPVIISQLMMLYLHSVEFTDEHAESAVLLIMETDLLSTMSGDEIAINGAAGIYEKYQRLLHFSGAQLVNQLVLENINFFNQDLAVQKEQLIQAAKDAVPADTSQVNAAGILALATQE